MTASGRTSIRLKCLLQVGGHPHMTASAQAPALADTNAQTALAKVMQTT
jgi:hypothetical protein